VLENFDVAVAVNLDEPYRHAQDILWLQVMAVDAQAAAESARDWVLTAPSSFEATGLVRRASAHLTAMGTDGTGRPLAIFWSAPVLASSPPASVVRHPVSGLRIGFVAHPRAEQRWLPAAAVGEFRLLTRKPTMSSDPAGLAPLVWRATDATLSGG
jgi:hypothetical protein